MHRFEGCWQGFVFKQKKLCWFKNHQENKALAVLQKQKGAFRPAQPHPFISQCWLHTLTGAKAIKLWSAKLPQTLPLIWSKVTQCSTRICNPGRAGQVSPGCWRTHSPQCRCFAATPGISSCQLRVCKTRDAETALGIWPYSGIFNQQHIFKCQLPSWAEQRCLGTLLCSALSTEHIQTNTWRCLVFAYDPFHQFASKLL